jgi:hypothetical protein
MSDLCYTSNKKTPQGFAMWKKVVACSLYLIACNAHSMWFRESESTIIPSSHIRITDIGAFTRVLEQLWGENSTNVISISCAETNNASGSTLIHCKDKDPKLDFYVLQWPNNSPARNVFYFSLANDANVALKSHIESANEVEIQLQETSQRWSNLLMHKKMVHYRVPKNGIEPIRLSELGVWTVHPYLFLITCCFHGTTHIIRTTTNCLKHIHSFFSYSIMG